MKCGGPLEPERAPGDSAAPAEISALLAGLAALATEHAYRLAAIRSRQGAPSGI